MATAQPTVGLSVAPTTIGPGSGADLNITIANPDPTPVRDLAFTYALPAGVTFQSQVTQNCGLSATATLSGGNTLTFADGTLPPSGSCQIDVEVMPSATAASFTFPVLNLTSSTGSAMSGTAMLNVDGATSSLGLQLSATPSTINLGERVTLNFTFATDAAATREFGAFDFDAVLPAGLELNGDEYSTTCALPSDQGITVDTASNTFSLDNSTVAPTGVPVLAAGSSCTVSIGARGVEVGTHVVAVNSYTALYNAFSTFFFNQFFTSVSSTAVTVQGPVTDAPFLTKRITESAVPGGTVDIQYGIANRNRSSDLTNVSFTDTIGTTGLPAMTLSSVLSDNCGGSFAASSGNNITYSGGLVTTTDRDCRIVARYTLDAGTSEGTFALPTGSVSGQFGGGTVTGNSTTDDLFVSGGLPLFSARVIGTSTAGGTATVRYTVQNQNSSTAMTDGQFRATFAEGASSAAQFTLPSAGSCGTSSTFAVVSTGIDMVAVQASDLELAPGGSCTFDIVQNISGDAPSSTYQVTTNQVSAVVGTTFLLPSFSNTIQVSGGLDLTAIQTFSGPVLPGATSTLVTTLTASAENAEALSNIAFSHDLGAGLSGLTVASVDSNTCGGSVANSGSSYSYSSGTLGAGASCDITLTVNVPASAPENTSATITTSDITATPTSAPTNTLRFGSVAGILATQSLTFDLDITGGPLVPGGTVTATYTIANNSASSSATGGFFTHNLPSAISGLSATGLPAEPCGTGSAISGTTFLIATGLNVPAGSSCSFQVTLVAPTTLPISDVTTTTSALTMTVGGTASVLNTASANIAVTRTGFFARKSFDSTTIVAGGTVQAVLDFTAETSTDVTDISLTDDVTSFVTGATIASIDTNTCGATVSGVGSGTLSVSSGQVTGNGSCQIAFSVSIPAATSDGTYTNTTSAITAMFSGTPVFIDAVSAEVRVFSASAPAIAKAFSPNTVPSSGSTTVTYTVNNPVGGGDLNRFSFSDDIGTDIPGATVSGATTTCGSGATLSGTSSLSLAGGTVLAGESCTVTATVTLPVLAAGSFTGTTSDVTDNGLTVADGTAATLNVVAAPPSFTAAVAPATIAQGGTARLTYTVSNAASGDALTGLNISQALGTVEIAATPNLSNTCGGTPLTGTVFGVVSGTVAAGGSCSIAVDITSVTTGAQTPATPTVTTALGPVTAETFTLTVTPAPAPGFAQAFAPDTIVEGETSRVTFAISNTGALIPANDLAFTNTLPVGLVVAATPNATTSCSGGTATAVAGTSTISLTSGSVAAGATCTVAINVRAVTDGNFVNTSGDLSSSLGTASGPSATLIVTPATPPTLAKAFAQASVEQGLTNTVTLTIDNTAAAIAATGLSVSDPLPTGIVVAATPNASTTCSGGTLTATADTNGFAYTGGSVAAGASCTIQVDVLQTEVGTQTNTTSDLTSSLGTSSSASAGVTTTTPPTVTAASSYTPTTVRQGEVSTYQVTLTSAAAAVDTTGIALSQTLPSGVTVAATPNASTTCTGGSVSATAGGTSVALSGGTLTAGASCTVNVDVVSAQIGAFATTPDSFGSDFGTVSSPSSPTATLTVQAAPAPTVTAAIAPNSFVEGATATLTYTLDNTGAAIDAVVTTLTDALPANLVIADTPNAATTCTGGTVTASGSTLSYMGGAIPLGGTCTISVDISSAVAATYANTLDTFDTPTGVQSGIAASSVTVTDAPAPLVALSVAPTTVAQGGTSRLTLELDNTGALISADTIALDLVFPAGAIAASTLNASSDCTGNNISATAGGLQVTATSLAAGASCTTSVDVVGLGVGGQTFSTQNVTSSLGSSANANAVLTVTAADVPTFAKSFTPDTVIQGALSRMEITIDNSANLIAATGGSFTDTLPTGITIARTPNLSASCGTPTSGTPSVPGSTTLTSDTVSVSGITVAAGQVCTYAVDVQTLQSGSFTSTTSALVTSLGDSGTAAAVLTVNAAPIPTLNASFTPDTVVQGSTSTLTVSIDNTSALVAAQSLRLSVPLPTDMAVAATPNAATTCSAGTLTATAGASSATYAGGFVAPGSTCTLSFDVISTALAASQTVTTSVLETSLGDTAAGANATLTLQAAPVPGFTASFTPDSILQGEVSTVTYQIDNSTALLAADDLAFAANFPNGIVIADTPNIANTCGATISATTASNTLTVSGGTLLASATCEISVDVTSATAAASTATTGDLTSTLGNSGPASANLTVSTGPVPTLGLAYAPSTVVQGGLTTVSFDIVNVASVEVTDVAFTHSLPTGLTIADPANLNNSCGGTTAATAGSNSVQLQSGTIAVGASCTVSVTATSATVGNGTGVFSASSSQGNSSQMTAAFEVTAAPVPTLSAALNPSSIVRGDVSALTLTIDNSTALVGASDLFVSLTLPSELTIAPTPSASTTCGSGMITTTGGGASFELSGGTVPSGGTCTVDVSLRAVLDGSPSVSATVTSSLGDSGTVSQTLTVTPANTPTLAASFTPSSIDQGRVSTLTFEIDNSAQLVNATNAAFTTTLDSGLAIATPANASTSCGTGSVSAPAGTTSVSLASGAIDAGNTCTVSVDITGTSVGTFSASTTTLETSLGSTAATSATLSITAAPAPGFASSFSPTTIAQGGTTRVTFAIDNSANRIGASRLGFNITLPAGLTLTGTPDASNTCGGAVTASPNGSTISLAGGSISAGSQCSVSADVTSLTEGTTGAPTGNLTSSLGDTGVSTPDAPLVVVNNPNGSITFIQNSSADDTFSFTSATSALNFAISTAGGTGSFGPIDLPANTYTVVQNRPEGVGNTSVVCSDADSVAVASTGTVTIVLDPLESLTCTFSSLSTRQETVDQINAFLNRRNNLLLSNGPSSSRRMARLNQGIGRTQVLQFQQGNLASMNPLGFNLLSIGSGSYSISTSLNDIQRSAHMFRLAFDGEDGNTQRWTPSRWDVWFEASYNRYEASQGSDGHFGIAHLGSDYLVNENLLVGLMLSVDSLDDGDDGGATIEGDGWMFGPYITARIAPNLIFDGRLAYGQSTNTISPFGTYADEFDTDRLLIDASLSGSYNWENWVVTPNLSLSYIEDRAESYTDSLNVVIPGQTVSLGQIRFGPTFSTTMQGRNHSIIEPSFAVNGIYNFGDTDGVTIVNGRSNESDGLRARIEAAVRITNRYGAKFEFGANYDGIGADDFESYGARVQVSIPLR
ncbi:autotransporter outer membrane beta-barrel domain-containing protein [Tateyamaria omphalii]|uniref:autotransporter outer membrane beta-barrel domain-containing protein n=1 Tax=Tateyamaria omphalii TaxID=299262 RepID=UPI001674A6A7|nr:autotransporter outer membrane beta-barrel domain-containing protein [Tateyamaria omphalii]